MNDLPPRLPCCGNCVYSMRSWLREDMLTCRKGERENMFYRDCPCAYHRFWTSKAERWRHRDRRPREEDG